MTQHKRQPERKANKRVIRRNADGQITRSRLGTTEAWGFMDMRRITNKWMQLGQNQPLMPQTTPLENIMAQVHNMIKSHGRHHKHDGEQWSLSHEALRNIFETKLPQPPFYLDSCQEYLIRGNPQIKASTPKFAMNVANKVLKQCSTLMLETRLQTSS